MSYDSGANAFIQGLVQNPASNAVKFENPGFDLVDSGGDTGKKSKGNVSATTDKDYIDARLKAMSDSLDQRLETAAAKSDGRLEVIETRIDSRISSIDAKLTTGIAAMDAKMDVNFARFEALLHKTTADVHKASTDTLSRVVAIVSGLVGIGITVIVLVINNMAPKPTASPPSQSSPIVVYPQQPAAPANVAPQANP